MVCRALGPKILEGLESILAIGRYETLPHPSFVDGPCERLLQKLRHMAGAGMPRFYRKWSEILQMAALLWPAQTKEMKIIVVSELIVAKIKAQQLRIAKENEAYKEEVT